MNSTLLKQWHVMFGVDLHDGLTAPLGIPVPKQMHAVIAPLKWAVWGSDSGLGVPSVRVEGSEALQRGSDIGRFIPHISIPPTNLLMPLYFLASGSKSEFGANTVMIGGQPAAVSVLGLLNLNSNCGGPLPPGMVIATNTVTAGFTIGDFLGGMASIAVDAAIQAGFDRLFASAAIKGRISRFTDRISERLMGECASEMVMFIPEGRMLSYAFMTSEIPVLRNSWVAANIEAGVKALGGVAAGLVFGDALGAASGGANDVIAGYFNNPGVEEHP